MWWQSRRRYPYLKSKNAASNNHGSNHKKWSIQIFHQCSGFRSFWAFRICYSEYVTDPDPSINPKIVRKLIIFTAFCLLYGFYMKNDVNVPSKSNKKKKEIFLFASWRLLVKRAGSGSVSANTRYGSPDPDCTKMSLIRNTVSQIVNWPCRH